MGRTTRPDIDNSPRPWALRDEDAPEAQTSETITPKPLTDAQAKRLAEKGNISTHTGTDPLGRAIGPNEDPTKRKKVRDMDGKVVTPDADGLTPNMRAARDKVNVPDGVKAAADIAADATGTDNADELALDVARQAVHNNEGRPDGNNPGMVTS